MDYRCKFCKKPGVHYFLFCPQNPDPNSIHRRRQAKLRLKGPSSPGRGVKRSPSPSWEVSEDHKTRKLSFSSTTVHNNDGGCASPESELGSFMTLFDPGQQSRPRLSSCDVLGKDRFGESKRDFYITDGQANEVPAAKIRSMPSTNENVVQNDTITRDFAHFKKDGILESKEPEPKSLQMEYRRKCNEAGFSATFTDFTI